jgi:CubicO group peptidase (beta-lactamase class C family)
MSVLKDLPRLLRSNIKKRQVPGASVAVLRNGRITAATAAGVINLDTKVPATADTVFQIGSITKIFTTTLIMQLVDEGKVELDAPIVHYLPSFRVADLDVSRQVTVRQFLSHQSGIDGDFFVDAGRGDDCVEKLVDMAVMLPSLFPIGEKHSYCNLGFAVLGRVAEVITGKTYDTLLRERIFESLGMDHALSLPEDTLRFRSAIGHVPSQRRKNVWYVSRQPYLTQGQKAAGSTPAMSVTDLLQFAQMHLNGGKNPQDEKILSARSVKAMQKRQIRVQKHTGRALTHWGLGWFLMDWNGTKLMGHDGATMGQFAFLRILPAKNLAVAMLTNGGDAGGLFMDVFNNVFEGLARTSEPAPPTPVNNIKVDLEKYVGDYANISNTFEFRIHRGELKVSSRMNGGGNSIPDDTKLAFIDKNTTVMRSGNPIVDRGMFLFSGEQDGKMHYVANGLRQFRRKS